VRVKFPEAEVISTTPPVYQAALPLNTRLLPAPPGPVPPGKAAALLNRSVPLVTVVGPV